MKSVVKQNHTYKILFVAVMGIALIITAVICCLILAFLRNNTKLSKSLKKSSTEFSQAEQDLGESKKMIAELQSEITGKKEAVEGYKECLTMTQEATQRVIDRTKAFKERVEANKGKQRELDEIYERLIEAEIKSYAQEKSYLLKKHKDAMSNELPRSEGDCEARKKALLSSRNMERKTRQLMMGYETGTDDLELDLEEQYERFGTLRSPSMEILANNAPKLRRASTYEDLSSKRPRRRGEEPAKVKSKLKRFKNFFFKKNEVFYDVPDGLEECDSPLLIGRRILDSSTPDTQSSEESTASISEERLRLSDPVDEIMRNSCIDSPEEQMDRNMKEMRFRMSLSAVPLDRSRSVECEQDVESNLDQLCYAAQLQN